MTKGKTTVRDIDSLLQQVALQEQVEVDQRHAAVRELIDHIHAGRLTDPQEIRITAATLGVEINYIRAEISRRDRIAELRARLAAEPKIRAELDDLMKQRDTVVAQYEAAVAKRNEQLEKLNPTINELTLETDRFTDARRQLQDLLDDVEAAPLVALHDELCLLNHRREELRNLLGTACYVQNGLRVEPFEVQLARQRAAITEAERQLATSRGGKQRWEQQKKQAQANASAIKQSTAAARQELAHVEDRIRTVIDDSRRQEVELLSA